MNPPENPYASPADTTPEGSRFDPVPADTALASIALEFRRCVPGLLALITVLILLAFTNAISSLMILRELLSYGILFLAIAGYYLLLAVVAWSLRGALLELSHKPTVSALTNAVLCSRTVYAFASFILLFAALTLGALTALGIMSALKWLE